ncbi:ATP-binding cassette domain-containing protein [Cryobacterium sp. TMT1-62]|uniref:multiple monosaccharide ABC transporter ATP-binding protein n=1 Tax=unclassified Cryobacterium TaxID=2649013 RepID=UPI000CE4B053|nr:MULTISPECIES: multiple monosaccharide ABC transporter ATP-binding protein [unclassified Cryobacterium]TFC32058.1 ATP-binding cassette domain-containing protein [Cryobacterium sp. TMT2-18-2]TFC39778.1 ATP-binding cassette domain-containing protein [Cryobacterium sp. TMT2-42-4]TFC39868.1 ATP-binding cassette domain-containing protein [Cryobacterium sp. TMT2-14]TFC58314.1 ATP-binding cassette domain-containing protein [Cryobacterium sp. TMT2-15-1]TFC64923.1 ATP-binding cassette domain-containi
MHNIVKDFSGVKALDGVSIDVVRGEVHAICGENGAGKSTLMKVLSGVYPAGSFEGTIEFENKPVSYKTINDSEADGIVIIHQELALSPYLSIAENIFLGNENSNRGIIDWNKTNREASLLLSRVGLAESPATRVLELGVGKQQLVEIAKALSKQVKLLILDEPTAALNDEDSAHLLGLIEHLRGQGITCIIISHKLKEIKRIADKVTVIRDGKTIETISMDGPDATEARIIRSMVGRELNNLFPPREPKIGAELLRVEDWTVYHPVDTARKVVDGASFSVRAGEIVGFAGLMGAGRTELAMSIFGRSYGTKITGSVFKNGDEIQMRTVDEAIRHGFAYATEDRKLYGLNLIGDITVNVSAAALGKLAKWGVIDRHREYKVANSYREKMNIKAPSVTSITGKLSGGNQQKVVLSKWIFAGPDILILDEPTRGIDVGAKYEIYGIINELAAQGKAVVVISSELPELIGLSDRIYVISEGKLTGEVTAAEASQETLMHYMTAGKD